MPRMATESRGRWALEGWGGLERVGRNQTPARAFHRSPLPPSPASKLKSGKKFKARQH